MLCYKEGHSPSQCLKVANINSRRDILRRYLKCFICLQGGHIAKDCKSNYICRKCDGKHNIYICTKKSTGQGPGNDDVKKTVTTHVAASDSILLQTAKANISAIGANDLITTRILFDSGSQRTYVTQNVRNTLKLKTIRTERMLIKTFGRNDNHIQKLDVVQLRIKSEKDDGYIYIEALVVPTICSPLTKQNISYTKNNFAHINNLELADSGDGLSVLSVGLLVGVDFYYSFFSGKIVKGINGPVASETILGWF